jgi:hypothetical protein
MDNCEHEILVVAYSRRSMQIHRAQSCRVKIIHGEGAVRIGEQCSGYFYQWPDFEYLCPPLSLPSPIPGIGHDKESKKIKVRYFCIWNLQLLTDPPIFS